MNVPMSATFVRSDVRWSTNQRLTEFSSVIVPLSGWVITQPTITSTATRTASVPSRISTVRPSDRPVGGVKRLSGISRVVPYGDGAPLTARGERPVHRNYTAITHQTTSRLTQTPPMRETPSGTRGEPADDATQPISPAAQPQPPAPTPPAAETESGTTPAPVPEYGWAPPPRAAAPAPVPRPAEGAAPHPERRRTGLLAAGAAALVLGCGAVGYVAGSASAGSDAPDVGTSRQAPDGFAPGHDAPDGDGDHDGDVGDRDGDDGDVQLGEHDDD